MVLDVVSRSVDALYPCFGEDREDMKKGYSRMLRKIGKNITVTQRAENLAVHELLLPSVHLVAGGVTPLLESASVPSGEGTKPL